jgi:Zn-finger nucleic acid-binding protein
VRLIACGTCHTQYDVTDVSDGEVTCRCGDKIANREQEGIEARVHRCGSCGAQVGADADACNYCGSAIIRDANALSLICPECFARNAEESRFCTACGVGFSPEPVLVEGHELPCPSCSCLMPVRAIGGIGINECPQCSGVWVPEDRFDHLIAKACEAAQARAGAPKSSDKARASGASPFQTKVVYRNCPVCDAHMQRANFRKRSGVIIDRCHSHGTWLDSDELEQIAGFILEGGMGRGGAHEYMLQTELNAARRRDAAAYARAASGKSIVIDTPRQAVVGDSLFGLLKNLLR